jgi:Bacterial regulatory proteins, lacI family
VTSPSPGRVPTIKDVAALAGVSWKTVTNVVHERSNVAPATRARVLAAGGPPESIVVPYQIVVRESSEGPGIRRREM